MKKFAKAFMANGSEARNSHQLVKTGIEWLYNHKPVNAMRCFEQALGYQSANPDGYYYLARAFVDLNNIKAARRTIKLVRRRFPAIFGGNEEFGCYPKLELSKNEPAQAILRNRSQDLKEQDESILESHIALEQGIDLLDQKAFAAAIKPLMMALEINIWNVHAYYYLGQAFANSGEPDKAVEVFHQAIKRFPFVFGKASGFGEYQGYDVDAKTVIAYYEAFSRQIPDVANFLSPCPRTGSSGTALTPVVEEKLKKTYKEAIELWQRSKTPEPALARAFLSDGHLNNASEYNASVMLVTPRYIKCSPDWDEYEVSFHLAGTGKSVLPNFSLHYSDRIHTENHQLEEPRSNADLAAGLVTLNDHVDRVRPDIVLFEGNFLGGTQSISSKELGTLKTKYGFKLATLVIDVNPPLKNYAAYWSKVSDLIIAMNENPYLDEARKNCPVIVYPGIPIDLNLINSVEPPERDLGVLFIGARKRYRDLWCAHMIEAGLPLYLKFTIQSLENSIRAHEFIEMTKRSRIIFNNGLVSSRDHGINLRIFEAMTSGAVLLQQDFDQLHNYFMPYVHYAPFTNVHEMISTARFLLKYQDIAGEITNAAFDWYRERYGAERFWHKIVETLKDI